MAMMHAHKTWLGVLMVFWNVGWDIFSIKYQHCMEFITPLSLSLSLSLFLHILSSLLPLSMTMAGNHLIVHILEPEVVLHIMATTPTEFADTEIWFCLSGWISKEGYQRIVNDMILCNVTRNRADQIIDQHLAPFLPPLTIRILTLEEFHSTFAEHETSFMIYVYAPPVVHLDVRQAIFNTTMLNGVE